MEIQYWAVQKLYFKPYNFCKIKHKNDISKVHINCKSKAQKSLENYLFIKAMIYNIKLKLFFLNSKFFTFVYNLYNNSIELDKIICII